MDRGYDDGLRGEIGNRDGRGVLFGFRGQRGGGGDGEGAEDGFGEVRGCVDCCEGEGEGGGVGGGHFGLLDFLVGVVLVSGE